MGPGIKGHTFTAPKITHHLPHNCRQPFPLGHFPLPPPNMREGAHIFLGKYTKQGVPQFHPLYSLNTPPNTPPFLYIYSTIFGKYQCFISLAFSLGPDEAATVGWPQKLVCDINVILLCFSNQQIN